MSSKARSERLKPAREFDPDHGLTLSRGHGVGRPQRFSLTARVAVLRFCCALLVLVVALTQHVEAAERSGEAAGRERVPWTTSRVVGAPGPPSPYRVELVFPHLTFDQLTWITNAPGTDRLFVGERYGRAFSFPKDPEVRQVDPLIDFGGMLDRQTDRVVRRELYGAAFHPRFETNRYVYLFITERKPQPPRTRIARFEMVDGWRLEPDSEHIILEYPSGGHDGGCLKFGPDGYLYITAGDGGGSNDQHATGQFIGDLLASILRIDVDGKHSAKSYGIPPDNPFLGVPNAAPEVYAYGFRNVWKISFDRVTGDLWAGDVGQDLWEMVYRVQRGGNYGWSVMEGAQEFRPRRPRGPSPILPPAIAHQHGESRSLTGGFVYRGTRLPELYGAYIYADYETGKIWGLRHDGKKATWSEELVDTELDIPAFGEDHDGELYLTSHFEAQIYRLVRRDPAEERDDPPFPERLSETGLFASTVKHEPAPGVIPYTVNAPLWSDAAAKERFLALPRGTKIAYHADRFWEFPDGAVFVKTFFLDTVSRDTVQGDLGAKKGVRRRLETRLLTRQGGEWAGYTYLWNDEQTDAVLLGRDALEKPYRVADPAAPGGEREQTWWYPSRADCMVCHNRKAGYVLGLSTLQMNRDHDYDGLPDNQLRALSEYSLFEPPLATPPEELSALVDPADGSAPLGDRARSYLHANCAHCHRRKGGGNSNFAMLYPSSLEETGTVGVPPLHGDYGVEQPMLVAPGAPERSLLYLRMKRLGPGRMPHIGSLEVDRDAVELVRRWIAELPDA